MLTTAPSQMSYVPQMIRCKNPRCKSCPHGPYWYGYQYVNGKRKKTYFGRVDPRPKDQNGEAQAQRAKEAAELAHKTRRIEELSFALGVKVTASAREIRNRIAGLRRREKPKGEEGQRRIAQFEAICRDLRQLRELA